MTTRMNIITDNSKRNIFSSMFIVKGLSPLSPSAYEEFTKIRKAYCEKGGDISDNWEYPPCFLIALREYFVATGSQWDVENMESVILSMDWLFDGVSYQTFYRKNWEHQEITIKQYNGNEEMEPKVYNTSNKQNLEVLRDLCLPMVYNW